jgi:hypothetical protein
MRTIASLAIIGVCLLFLGLPPEPVEVFKDQNGRRIGSSTLMGSTTVLLSPKEEEELVSKGRPVVERVAQDDWTEDSWRRLFKMPR